MSKPNAWVYVGLVVVLAAGLLAGCGRSRVKLAAEDSGGQASLKPGQTITLELKSNPTTGYSWEFVGLETQDVVELDKEDYTADSKLIGAGGVQTFRLRALKPGSVRLELVYHRPWETDSEPAGVFSYEVTVAD